ncbi:hypothetical protein [Desulfovibrio oxyclinae]|uniref:hypothetical protein n=1 Tax=Desulfovibrio oxyclinae TaxID=63560 RepID=UPI0003773120|nr:hypothetical protein [Desulfovibrio oxyclinae]
MNAARLDDYERLALLEHCCQWQHERYGVRRVPATIEQIHFYEHPVPDLLEDNVDCLRGPGAGECALRSLIAGALWTLLLALWADSFDPWLMFWVGLCVAFLLVFPIALIFHRRKIVEVRETDGSPEIAAALGMACFDSGLLRAGLHRLTDLILLPVWMSYGGALRLRLEREYAEAHGMTPRPETALPLRWRRGAELIRFLEQRLGADGLSIIVRRL